MKSLIDLLPDPFSSSDHSLNYYIIFIFILGYLTRLVCDFRIAQVNYNDRVQPQRYINPPDINLFSGTDVKKHTIGYK